MWDILEYIGIYFGRLMSNMCWYFRNYTRNWIYLRKLWSVGSVGMENRPGLQLKIVSVCFSNWVIYGRGRCPLIAEPSGRRLQSIVVHWIIHRHAPVFWCAASFTASETLVSGALPQEDLSKFVPSSKHQFLGAFSCPQFHHRMVTLCHQKVAPLRS